MSLLLSSNFGSSLFILQYSSISFLSVSIKGLIYLLSLLGSIPFSPRLPAPLIIFIKTVSTLSFILCAIAILLKPVSFKTSSKKPYLTFLPSSSRPILSCFASLVTSSYFIYIFILYFSQYFFMYSVSSPASLRIPWFTCATAISIFSFSFSLFKISNKHIESGPPDTAISTLSPDSINLYFFMVFKILSSILPSFL